MDGSFMTENDEFDIYDKEFGEKEFKSNQREFRGD